MVHFRLNMSLDYGEYDSGDGEQSYFQFVNSTFPTKNMAPVVTSVSPNNGPSTGGTSVTITGIGFTGETSVLFGIHRRHRLRLANAASVDSQIIATAPAGSAGTVDVTVTTPIGTSAKSSADQYTYSAPVNTIGLYQQITGIFYLKNSNSGGNANNAFQYGWAGNGDLVPLVGDWTGSGVDTIGLYQTDTGIFYLKNSNSGGNADNAFQYQLGE